jgi:hypothetical protein
MPPIPEWDIPKDLQARLDSDEGGMWDDDRWAPILLTVMKGTSYRGCDVPLAWQIEFEPPDEVFRAANKKIQKLGIDPDGHGWANVLNTVVAEHHPEIVDELHFGDTEVATCVLWIESEDTCRLLVQIAWSLIHEA